MKPKTKLQKKIVGLSRKVEPPTAEQKQWANEAIFDNYYVECRNRNYCLECGRKWNGQEANLSKYILPTTCPGCEVSNLCHVEGWDTDQSKYEYWAIIDVLEGFQVVRMFFGEKYMKRKQPAEYLHHEVMQHWIREDGNMTSLTMRCNAMGTYNYYDAWSTGSELEVRTDSPNHRLRCSIAPFKICPGRNTLPVIRRNGYDGYFKGQAPNLFFSAILSYPKAETLLKAGQISLFKKCVEAGGIHKNISTYWSSICIAMRHDYIVGSATDWLDYLGMLQQLGKDLNNPRYVCPDDFNKAHSRVDKKLREINRQKQLEKKKKKIAKENQKYVRQKRPFFDLKFNAGDIAIEPLKSVEEFLVEGDKLKHCLFNSNYHKRDNSLVLSARIDGETVETVEVDLQNMKVAQSRGLQNQPSQHHDKIVTLIRENMGKIAAKKTG